LVHNLWNSGLRRNFFESTPEGESTRYALCPSHRWFFPTPAEAQVNQFRNLIFHSMKLKARFHLVYFIGTAALLSMVSWTIRVVIRWPTRKTCIKAPGALINLSNQRGQLSVRWSLHYPMIRRATRSSRSHSQGQLLSLSPGKPQR
jgi:hypothetical protein